MSGIMAIPKRVPTILHPKGFIPKIAIPIDKRIFAKKG